ncbi:major facilitator superfamily domain-containing protein [Powellomyces hirtus]|nr:major facilitator superfamily domain-containing protein [Powellomyces hirtus]
MQRTSVDGSRDQHTGSVAHFNIEDSDRDTIGSGLSRKSQLLFVQNIACVSLAWALGYIVQFIHISSSVVIAKELVNNDRLATIPVGLISIGTIIASFPLSVFGERVGMKRSFLLAASSGLVGAVLSFVALYIRSFALLCPALLLQGIFMGGTAILRFTAKTLSPEKYVSRSLSIIVGGAALGALVGPNIAKYTEHSIASVRYGGAYLVVIALVVLQMITISLVRFPNSAKEAEARSVTNTSIDGAISAKGENRSEIISRLMRNSTFQIALIAGVVSYMTMTLFMAPVPLSMLSNGYTYHDQANVLMSHLLGMFAPSLFTGYFIEKLGAFRMITAGFLLMIIGAGLLLAELSLLVYFSGETLIGLGWNFAYITSSSMVAKVCISQRELATLQGVNDTMISISAAVFTLASGAVYRGIGWNGLLWLGLTFLVAALLALIVLFVKVSTLALNTGATRVVLVERAHSAKNHSDERV